MNEILSWCGKYILANKEEMARFLIVGVGATIVHVLIAFILCSLFYSLSLFLANTVAFFVAFNFSFVGHKYFTFNNGGDVKKFFIVSIAGFLLNNVILMGVVSMSGKKLFSIMIATSIVPLVTYILSKIWAFKQKGDLNA